MAVRFINPIEVQYESQFVPMPLDFMYKSMQEKQKGLDTSRSLLQTSDLNLDGAPWDIDQGNVLRKKNEYLSEIQKLSENLSTDKENYAHIAESLGNLNIKYKKDPEIQRILKHKEYFDANVAPHLGKPNAASLYFRNLMETDDNTGELKWKQANTINLDDIRTPIEDKTSSYVMDNFGKYLTASVNESLPSGYSIEIDEETGLYVIKEPGGEKVENLNLDSPYIKTAIQNYSNVLMNEESDQSHYIKEFLHNPYRNKRGFDNKEDLQNFITNVVSSRFYTSESKSPERYQFVTPKNDSDSGSNNSNKGKIPDFGVTITSSPDNIIKGDNYLDILAQQKEITIQQLNIIEQSKNNAFHIINELDTFIPGLHLGQQVQNIYQNTGDPLSSATKSFILLANTISSDKYKNLPEETKTKLQPYISELNSQFTQLSNSMIIKNINQGITDYISGVIAKNSIPSDVINNFMNNYGKKGDIVGRMGDAIDKVEVKLNRDLTTDEKTELLNLIVLRKTALGGLNALFANKNDYTVAEIDGKIANIVGINNHENLFTISGRLYSEPNMLEYLENNVDVKKASDLLAKGVKIDRNNVKISKIGEIDTHVEQFIEGYTTTLKEIPFDKHMALMGFNSTSDLKKAIIFNTGVTGFGGKDFKYVGFEIVDNPEYGMPSALHTYQEGEGKSSHKFSVLAPLVTTDNRSDLIKISRDLYAKAINNNDGALEDLASRLNATATMSEIDYLKINMLARLSPIEGDRITFDFGDGNITLTKIGNHNYQANIFGITSTLTNPYDIITDIGAYNFMTQIHNKKKNNEINSIELVDISGKFKTKDMENTMVSRNVYDALVNCPIQGFTITSALRTKNNKVGIGEHGEGKAVDLADNEHGANFYNWILSNTPEVQNWKRKYNFNYIMYHDNKDGLGKHYHLKFN